MSDPALYTYPSPLAGYEDRAPLPDEKNADGKSFCNPETGIKSTAYEQFVGPITNGIRGGFDIHIYYYQNNPAQSKFAQELWQRIRYEFPELRIYKLWDRPIGPHTLAMFEVNVFTPLQFGAFVSWLVVNRGPLSALVHPNTGDDVRDHSQRATWLGREVPVDLSLLIEMSKSQGAAEEMRNAAQLQG
ncbi:DOPA-like domain-containing protein [Geopyxis carbonaria]|nr:DOPA-like domain-containing protein [Geopyxis carbonaria]